VIPLLPALALFMGGSLLLATFWDDLRDRVFRWAEAHGYQHLAKVVLRVDTLVGAARRWLQEQATPVGGRTHVVEEREVDLADLPSDVRARLRHCGVSEIDVSDQLTVKG
jgi:hypothetical protein